MGGREGVCRELGGGGLNIFFRGRNAHQVIFRELMTLSFLWFFWKKARKTTQKNGFFIPTEPLKSLEKKGKTLEKTRNSSLLRGRKQGIPQKTRKARTGDCNTYTTNGTNPGKWLARVAPSSLNLLGQRLHPEFYQGILRELGEGKC